MDRSPVRCAMILQCNAFPFRHVLLVTKMKSSPVIHAAACLLVAITVFITGCASSLPVMPSELSGDTFMQPLQRGAVELWKTAIDEARTGGKPRVHIINQGEETLLARINLIRSAPKTIRIQPFMWGAIAQEWRTPSRLVLRHIIQFGSHKGLWGVPGCLAKSHPSTRCA